MKLKTADALKRTESGMRKGGCGTGNERGKNMWMNLYGFKHNSLGMHFWELPALLAGVVTLVELVVHSHKQKKREKQFDEDREERLKNIQQEATGNPAASR